MAKFQPATKGHLVRTEKTDLPPLENKARAPVPLAAQGLAGIAGIAGFIALSSATLAASWSKE